MVRNWKEINCLEMGSLRRHYHSMSLLYKLHQICLPLQNYAPYAMQIVQYVIRNWYVLSNDTSTKKIFSCSETPNQNYIFFEVKHKVVCLYNVHVISYFLCSTGAFRDSGAGAGLGNFLKRWVRVRRDSAIKKLLKISLFIFSIYFYY